LVKPVHDRMPAIIRPADYEQWIAANELPPRATAEFLGPYPAAEMRTEPCIEAGKRAPRMETGSLFDL
jgi:putative SOS response-associated peptidase YedK